MAVTTAELIGLAVLVGMASLAMILTQLIAWDVVVIAEEDSDHESW